MTALHEFERLECPGIWRSSSDAQRQDVVLSLGEASLTISKANDTAIAHWSLPAIERINPGRRPALFRPGGDATETLEVEDETMIRAIKRVQRALERRRPHPGRLRLGLTGGMFALGMLVAVFWLPGAMKDYTASVVPQVTREAIGSQMLARIARVSGRPCSTPLGDQALVRLHSRLLGAQPGQLHVLANGVRGSRHLPGGIILLASDLVEDYETPEVVAGFVLAENLRAELEDPVRALLQFAGLRAAFTLLTTGQVRGPVLARFTEHLLTTPPAPLDQDRLLAAFADVGVRASPYAYALDISGETTLGLIEADPLLPASLAPVLDDADWVSLQGICGG